jgi:hypothetical protein
LKNGTEFLEFFSQLDMVVYLSIVDDAEISAPVPHGLGAVGEVYDGQSLMAQEDPLCCIMPVSLPIGSSMGKGVSHGKEVLQQSRSVKSTNAAHNYIG